MKPDCTIRFDITAKTKTAEIQTGHLRMLVVILEMITHSDTFVVFLFGMIPTRPDSEVCIQLISICVLYRRSGSKGLVASSVQSACILREVVSV